MGINDSNRDNYRKYVRNGALTDDAIKKVFPEFKDADAVAKDLTGRKSSVKIMSTEAFEKLKTGKEVIGE